jgi:uncharacterized membrane protein
MMLGFGMGFGLLGLVVLFAVICVLIVGSAWLVRGLFPGSGSSSGRAATAKELLDQRYARGELARAEYEAIKQDLSD